MFSAASKTGSKAAPPANYIEDFFSTYLYTGTSAPQTISNGLDLLGKGGLTWLKYRSGTPQTGYGKHILFDTARGNSVTLSTDSTAANETGWGSVYFNFLNNGFDFGTGSAGNQVYLNKSGVTYASWSFAKQPKFFDVVTYTGDGASSQTISHNLGSTPGMIIVKNTSATNNWYVYHRSLSSPANNRNLLLNLTNTQINNGVNVWNVTSTTFEANLADLNSNTSGQTYVAYIFAHNAGGFGTSGTDNVISCDSYTTDGSGNVSVSLGYEPQYVLVKKTNGTSGWYQQDIMRSMSQTGALYFTCNTSNAEANPASPLIVPTATGFDIVGGGYGTGTFIYMAIRRPMKVPTDATTVFNPVYGQSGAPGFRSTNFNAGIDTAFYFYPAGYNDGTNAYPNLQNRLIGTNQLQTPNTRTELSLAYNTWDYMNGVVNLTFLDTSFGSWMFKRASSFHDVVCYTGTLSPGAGGSSNITHNLGVAPELLIVRSRNQVRGWPVYSAPVGVSQTMFLSTTLAATTVSDRWAGTAPTSTVFTVGDSNQVNETGTTYVAYLFATCPGVSKVGSYTGNGTTQAISCGFTGGARFVLIKRTDSTGDWYVWDTTRGMTSLTSPYLTLNTYNAQAATLGSVTTTTGGFTVNASILSAINTSGASYIFLAIA